MAWSTRLRSTYAGRFFRTLFVAMFVAIVFLEDGWAQSLPADDSTDTISNHQTADVPLVLRRDPTGADRANHSGSRSRGASGGAAMADFDSLIDLITGTVAPDKWDIVGGAGAIEPFPTGVSVDTSGIMTELLPTPDTESLGQVRQRSAADSGNRDVHSQSKLRKVSLVRLERQLQRLKAMGKAPDEAMRGLAGVYRVKYLFVLPQRSDIVLAGPAGDWRTDAKDRRVNVETGSPVLQLDDFVTVLRNAYEQHGRMGCAIQPRRENLAAAKEFLDGWNGKSLRPGQRKAWLEELRERLGKQDVKVWGIDADTHTARTLLQADYHMKLIGMGLKEGTLGVVSYLDDLKQSAGDRNVPMTVLRWWFTLNYKSVRISEDRQAFQWDGPGVKVLSENEMLTKQGKRIHTGESDIHGIKFARSFTTRFEILADKYPVYAELRNIFDLALICGILRAEDLPAQVGWKMTHFSNQDACHVPLQSTPREIDSVINMVNVNQRRFLVGVSGGVSVDTNNLLSVHAVKVDSQRLMDAAVDQAVPHQNDLPPNAWWWD
ncbi:MAG: DUF1598 domain-containing protein [Planctomycetota bacterium]